MARAESASEAPRVSVVIPTFNRASVIGRCLDSLVAQTFVDFEVLVCDDGSTDDTREVVERYQTLLRIAYHWSENFGGPARPRNEGLRRARGVYVAFLDSDDWWAPRKLSESVRSLDAGADIVYHDLYEASSRNQRWYWRKRRTRQLERPVFDDLFDNGNAICNSSVVVRRDLMLKLGGFSEDRALIAWEDFDAWLRLAKVTDRFTRLDEPFGYYWKDGSNLSSPRRLIANLERFGELYVSTEEKPDPDGGPAWYHYLLGRASYQVGRDSVVRVHMRRALAAGLPASHRAKAVFTVLASELRGRLAALR